MNFENQLAYGEVTDKNLMSCFLVDSVQITGPSSMSHGPAQRILRSYFSDFALTHDQAEHIVKLCENLQWRRRLYHLFRINL